jgi:hypothetical protein
MEKFDLTIAGSYVGEDLDFLECATAEELRESVLDDILADSQVKKQQATFFCSRCKQQILVK